LPGLDEAEGRGGPPYHWKKSQLDKKIASAISTSRPVKLQAFMKDFIDLSTIQHRKEKGQ